MNEEDEFQKAASDWLKHAVDIEYYGNGVVGEIIDNLNELYDKISDLLKTVKTISSKRIYEDLLEQISNLLDEYSSDIDSGLENRIAEIAETESEWLQDFAKALGLSYLIPRTIKSQVQFVPYADNSSYKDISTKSSDKIKTNIDTALRTAYLMKDDTDSVIERLNANKDKYEKWLTTDIKTFNTATFRNTDLMMYRFNKQKVRYISVLDSHTCIYCGSMHGQIFNADSAPIVPVHSNCRCTLQPYFENENEPEFNSFSEWIETLDDDELYEVLGKERFNLYKHGLSIDSFVDSGKVLTVKELKSKENLAEK